MNGKRFLLDTNAVIALLRDHPKVIDYSLSAQWLGISIITLIEFISFPSLTFHDRELFDQFVSRVEVIDLTLKNESLIDLIAQIRRNERLKFPDATIGATALHYNATLVTLDKQFAVIKKLSTLSF